MMCFFTRVGEAILIWWGLSAVGMAVWIGLSEYMRRHGE